jgi:hypothetical protein
VQVQAQVAVRVEADELADATAARVADADPVVDGPEQLDAVLGAPGAELRAVPDGLPEPPALAEQVVTVVATEVLEARGLRASIRAQRRGLGLDVR